MVVLIQTIHLTLAIVSENILQREDDDAFDMQAYTYYTSSIGYRCVSTIHVHVHMLFYDCVLGQDYRN